MLLLIFALLVIYSVIDFVYRRTNRYKNKFEDVKVIRSYKNTSLDIINIGSTQARYAYDYSNVSGLNLGSNEQSVKYSFLLLKKYLPYLKKGGQVIISVSDMDLIIDSDMQERKYKYFGILPIGIRNVIKEILFPLLFKPKDIKYIFKDEKIYNKFDLDENILADDSAKAEDCKRRLNRWSKYGADSFDKNKGFSISNKNADRNIELVKDIIKLCINEGYGVTIVTPPVSPYFREYFGDAFEDILNKPLKELAETENVIYYDFTEEESFKDESLFLNTACMNKKGRRKFTDIIVQKFEMR